MQDLGILSLHFSTIFSCPFVNSLSTFQNRAEQNVPHQSQGSRSHSSSAPCSAENGQQVRFRRPAVTQNDQNQADNQARGQAHGEINNNIPQRNNNRSHHKYLIFGLITAVTILSLVFDYLSHKYPDSTFFRNTYSFLRSSCKFINMCY